MEIQITFSSEDNDFDVSQASLLTKEIKFHVPEVETIRPKKQIEEDDAGVLMDTIVQVFLGKNFLEKIADIVKTWIEKRAEIIIAKRAKIQFEIKRENGEAITIILENANDAEHLLKQIKTFIPN